MSRPLQSHSREWLFCLFALVLLTACSEQASPSKLAGATMGTVWHVSYVPGESAPDVAVLQSGIEAELDRIDRSMSTYRPDSEISLFNAYAPNAWFKASPEFIEVMSTALQVGEHSEGAYDVTVSPLVDLWGFGPTGIIDSPPTEEAIARVMTRVGQHNIELDAARHRLMKKQALSVDFSSLAKGYAVDLVADWLEAHGVNRYMVEVGGEMRLSGLSGRGDPWRIAIEQPESSERSVATTVSLSDVALATSGDYRNYFEANGKRYSHSIDPRTGYPVAHDLVSVTVVHPSCMIADAWATALTVLGAERAMAVAQAQGLAVYFIRRVEGGFEHSQTPQFSRYLGEPQQKDLPHTEE
ncbi:MAG: FAD:protein FMN transferase [Halioglobus sp.]|nr:FAD:protein FMN transferase [Halioglobus sp.]